ncbi:MAG: ABC transporter permease [Fimbriimonadales bacterium]
MRRLLRTPEAVTVALLVLAFAAGTLQSKHFLDAFYLLDRTADSAEAGLLVLGMTFVIVCGEIDLSVASNLALCSCIVAKLMAAGLPPLLAVVLGVLAGGLFGALNGALIAYAKLPSFLVTLGTLAFLRGSAQALMGAASVSAPDRFKGINSVYLPFTGIPLPVAILALTAVILGFVLHRTVVGRWIFAVGSNDQAALFSAVPTRRLKFSVFVLSGCLAGGAGAMIDSSLGVARYDHAKGLELVVITATVLGGASIYGGRGTIIGSVLALLLIVVIQSGMGVANVQADYQLAIIGAILVLAVGLNVLARRWDR